MMDDAENDEVLRFTHEWYDMTREEQIDLNFKRVARAFQVYKNRYTDYKIDYINWYSVMFQGIVSRYRNKWITLLKEYSFFKDIHISTR